MIARWCIHATYQSNVKLIKHDALKHNDKFVSSFDCWTALRLPPAGGPLALKGLRGLRQGPCGACGPEDGTIGQVAQLGVPNLFGALHLKHPSQLRKLPRFGMVQYFWM